jgi:hypothetical protein
MKSIQKKEIKSTLLNHELILIYSLRQWLEYVYSHEHLDKLCIGVFVLFEHGNRTNAP